MAHVERLRVYPIKGFDGTDVRSATLLPGGTLEFDREFALYDRDGEVINGKRTPQVHDVRTSFDLEDRTVTVETNAGERATFDLVHEQERTEAWFGEFFETSLEVYRDTTLGYVDRRSMGPSVISTETLRTVASWFDEITVEGARRRLRANVEISDVPPFWEDRFIGPDAPHFEIDGIRFEGVEPCGRCVVPERDPDTGDPIPAFRERFVEKRKETFPEWASEAAFDHYYALMIITDVLEGDRGSQIRIGSDVVVAG